jgi:hypothetical protein
MVAPTNASKWRMGFNSAFKGLIYNFIYINDINLAELSLSFSNYLKILKLLHEN